MQMREQHDKLQEEYSQQELLGGAASLGLQEGIDDKALADNKAYMDATKAAADELATKGFIDSGRRRQLIELKNQYAQTVLPIQNALKVRQEAIDFDRKMKAQDQTYRSTFDPSRVAVTDYLKNNQAFTPQGVSVGIMSKDAANEFAQLKNLVSQKYPTIAQSGVIGTLWTKVNSGVSMDEIAGFIKNEAANKNIDSKALSALGQEMHNIVENNLQKHGAYKAFGNDPKAINELRSSVANMAIYSLGDPKFGQMNDPMAVARAQAAEAAVEPPGKTHKEYDAAFDKKNFDEIDKLVNAAGFKPGTTSQKPGAGTNMYLAGEGAPTLKFDEKFGATLSGSNKAQQELFKRAKLLGKDLGFELPTKIANKDLPAINKRIAEALKDQYRTANLSRHFFNPSDETTKKFASAISELKDVVDVNGDKIDKSKIFKSGKLIGDAYLVRGHNGTTLKTVDEDGNQISIPFDISKLGSTKLADLDRAVRTLTNDQISKRYSQPGLTKDDLEDEIDRILTSEQYTQTKSQNTNPGYTPYGR